MSESNEQDRDVAAFWNFYRLNFRLHVVFLAISTAIILCSFLMRCEGESTVRIPGLALPMPETCMSRRLWGLDCPGCGLTRSFISMSHGMPGRAFSFNPAGPLVYLFVFAQIPWHSWQLFRLLSLRRPTESLWLYAPLFSICGALLIQWIWRITREDQLWMWLN